jgi:hypothetical protein
MRSQVQVLAGPPTISPAHNHEGRSSARAPLAALPGSCHPHATTSGSRVLRLRPGGLDQVVQRSRNGSVAPRHDVLVAQGGSRGRVPHPHHQLPGAGAGGNRQGRCGVAQVMKAQPSTPAARVAGIQTRRVRLLRRMGPPRSAGNTSPSGPGSAWVLRCSASASAATVGSVTVRRLAPVLGAAEGESAPHLQELLGHGDLAVQQVHPLHPEARQFPPPQARVGGDQDQRPEARRDRVGQGATSATVANRISGAGSAAAPRIVHGLRVR